MPNSILDAISLEEGIPQPSELKLAALGHTLQVVTGHQRALFGRGQVISRGSSWWRPLSAGDDEKSLGTGQGNNTQDDIVYWAGSDPRGDGLVAGY